MGHTLLQLIDKSTGQQYTNPHRKLAVFVSNLRSALPQALDLLPYNKKHTEELQVSSRLENQAATVYSCPRSTHWEIDVSEDIHVQSPVMNVLSMDGKRRWLDIEELVCLVIRAEKAFLITLNFDIKSC